CRGGAHETPIDVDVGAARHARERYRACPHLALQVGGDGLSLAGTHRGGGAGRVVTCEFETNVVPAGCGAEVQRRVADERAVHVDVGAARVRLECQRAPARLGRRATDVVEGGVGYPAILGDGVDDDREALGEAFFTDVA